MRASGVAGLAVLAVVLASASAFAVAPAPDRQLSPVAFDDTLATGLTGVDVQRARAQGYEIPRAETFYSQFRYVVGYYGIEAAVEARAAPTTDERFGKPLVTFVTDYSGTRPRLTPEGFVTLERSTYRSWTRAGDAYFVVDSGARTPGGPATVPFSERADARAFAAAYGGSVLRWDALAGRVEPERGWATVLERRTTERTAWADATVADARGSLDRPVSLVVGEDVPTLAAAVDAAPPNTTIRLPPGTYDGNVTVDKPVTLSGAGEEATVVDGGGVTGSVVTLAGPEVAISNLAVTGVGDRNIGNLSAGTGTGWDARIQLVYGRGDAGIRLADATGALVADVTVRTPSNGIVALNSTGAVVTDVSVDGTERWQAGFMGVLPMHSRMVVQNVGVEGGRDGVYTHRADGSVIRNSTFRSLRFGVHEMYTSDLLVTGNTMRETDVGAILMTRPAGNVLLGNDVRNSEVGLSTGGSATVTAENVLVGNDIGLSIATTRSAYVHNTVTDNGVAVREDSLLPTNEVFGNDLVGNRAFVDTGRGVRLVWAREGRGNYWGPVPGLDRNGDGVVERAFRPTEAVDAAATGGGGPALLARSPAVGVQRTFQAAVPGLRPSGVIDPSPLAGPVRPDALERATARGTAGEGAAG